MLHKKIMLITGILAILVVGFSACGPTQTPRKKMPGFLDDVPFENDYPFKTKRIEVQELSGLSTSQDAVMFEGRSIPSVVLSLPSPEYDNAIIAMVQEYKPVAMVLLANWVGKETKGVVLELHGSTGMAIRQVQYSINKPGVFSIPFTLRWNQASAGRANVFMGLLNDTPGITIEKIK